MTLIKTLSRITLAAALVASLGACAVGPAYPVGYRPTQVYVETYPTYRSAPPPAYYYGYDRGGYRHDHHHYEQRRSYNSPMEDAARAHRDVRRSLGLPRLPGMP